ncbi:MAG TPA: D-alanyl-D-alanine carboxypeptidase family protein, partial [Candidatus Limnocylindrales bacterium]|nr:D-alanyl-D-alanine carboxypeptidase family protein [Candidatus Limnocylindrales bacterium]
MAQERNIVSLLYNEGYLSPSDQITLQISPDSSPQTVETYSPLQRGAFAGMAGLVLASGGVTLTGERAWAEQPAYLLTKNVSTSVVQIDTPIATETLPAAQSVQTSQVGAVDFPDFIPLAVMKPHEVADDTKVDNLTAVSITTMKSPYSASPDSYVSPEHSSEPAHIAVNIPDTTQETVVSPFVQPNIDNEQSTVVSMPELPVETDLAMVPASQEVTEHAGLFDALPLIGHTIDTLFDKDIIPDSFLPSALANPIKKLPLLTDNLKAALDGPKPEIFDIPEAMPIEGVTSIFTATNAHADVPLVDAFDAKNLPPIVEPVDGVPVLAPQAPKAPEAPPQPEYKKIKLMDGLAKKEHLKAKYGGVSGKLKDDELESLGSGYREDHKLHKGAILSFKELAKEYKKELDEPLVVNDTYRPYWLQVDVRKRKPLLAAEPGRSNHGWGLAVDLGGGVQTFGSREYKWMKANAHRFGWYHPAWAEPDGSKPEAWHWEFAGKIDLKIKIDNNGQLVKDDPAPAEPTILFDTKIRDYAEAPVEADVFTDDGSQQDESPEKDKKDSQEATEKTEAPEQEESQSPPQEVPAPGQEGSMFADVGGELPTAPIEVDPVIPEAPDQDTGDTEKPDESKDKENSGQGQGEAKKDKDKGPDNDETKDAATDADKADEKKTKKESEANEEQENTESNKVPKYRFEEYSAAMVAALVDQESDGRWHIKPNSDKASGGVQYTKGTWNGRRGYEHAYQAPASIQYEEARKDVDRLYDKFENWKDVGSAWYGGAGFKKNDVHRKQQEAEGTFPAISEYGASVES